MATTHTPDRAAGLCPARWGLARAALVVAVGVVALVGCSSGSDDDGLSPATPPQEPPSSGTTIDVADLEEMNAEDCGQLEAVLDAGPTDPLRPGSITEEEHQQTLADLDAAIASVPDQARPAMETFGDAYREVLDELAALDGDVGDPATLDADRLARIEDLMTQPEVREAIGQLEAWTSSC